MMALSAVEFYKAMVVVMGFGIGYVSLLLIHAIWQFSKKQKQIFTSVRILFILYLSCYDASFIFGLCSFQTLVNYHQKLTDIPASWEIITSLAISMHTVALALYYVILLTWLHKTFNDAGIEQSLQISKWVYPCYGAGLLIMVTFISLYCHYQKEVKLWQSSDDNFHPSFLVVVAIINGIMGISVIYMFNSRLRKIYAKTGDSSPRQKRENTKKIMTKLFVLGGISVFFVLTDFSLVCAYQLIVEQNRDWTAGLILWCSVVFVVFIEILCSYLIFKFNEGCYDCICGPCHQIFKRRTERMANREEARQQIEHNVQQVAHVIGTPSSASTEITVNFETVEQQQP